MRNFYFGICISPSDSIPVRPAKEYSATRQVLHFSLLYLLIFVAVFLLLSAQTLLPFSPIWPFSPKRFLELPSDPFAASAAAVA